MIFLKNLDVPSTPILLRNVFDLENKSLSLEWRIDDLNNLSPNLLFLDIEENGTITSYSKL